MNPQATLRARAHQTCTALDCLTHVRPGEADVDAGAVGAAFAWAAEGTAATGAASAVPLPQHPCGGARLNELISSCCIATFVDLLC
jgi:hypothetical protein